MTTKEIGDFGENEAEKYLSELGYEILERNYRLKSGEIDIIAEDNGCVVFVEVKTRKNNFYGEPSEYVDFRKQEHIKRTAILYVGNVETDMRFDVIEVFYTMINGEPIKDKINHIKEAF